MKLISIAFLLLFSGCASTPYQKMGFTGGYYDQPLGNDMHTVGFSGNGFTGTFRANRFFLRRCAELALKNGHHYFIVLNQQNEVSTHVTGGGTSGTITPSYGGGYNYSSNTNYSSVSKPSSEGVIKTFLKGTQPPNSYDATFIFSQPEELE
jgi:hypothetical protein